MSICYDLYRRAFYAYKLGLWAATGPCGLKHRPCMTYLDRIARESEEERDSIDTRRNMKRRFRLHGLPRPGTGKCDSLNLSGGAQSACQVCGLHVVSFVYLTIGRILTSKHIDTGGVCTGKRSRPVYSPL